MGLHRGVLLVSHNSSLFLPWLDRHMGREPFRGFSFPEAVGLEDSKRGVSSALDCVVFFLAFSLLVNEETIYIHP